MVPLLARGVSENLSATKREVAPEIDIPPLSSEVRVVSRAVSGSNLILNDETSLWMLDDEMAVEMGSSEELSISKSGEWPILDTSDFLHLPCISSIVNNMAKLPAWSSSWCRRQGHRYTLRQVGHWQVPVENDGSNLPALALPDEKQLASSLATINKKPSGTVSSGSVEFIYISSLTKNLVIAKNFEVPAFLTTNPEPITVARQWVVRSATEDTDGGGVPDDDEEGEDPTVNSLWRMVLRSCSTLLPFVSSEAIAAVSVVRTVPESTPLCVPSPMS